MQFHHASALVCGWRAEVDLASNQTPMVDVAGLFASLKNMGIKVGLEGFLFSCLVFSFARLCLCVSCVIALSLRTV